MAEPTNLKETADKLLERIPNDLRCGDDWNEIQAAMRDLEYSEDVQKDVKALTSKLNAFVKEHVQ